MFYHPNYYKKLRKQYRDSIEALPRNGESLVLEEAPSDSSSKPQAPSDSSSKPYQINYDDFCKGDEEPQASSSKPQASSVKLQAPSSDNPEVTSSPIREPGTKKYWTSFEDRGPRASTKINVFLGCDLWKAIWCGENLTLFPFVHLSSKVKKWPEVL